MFPSRKGALCFFFLLLLFSSSRNENQRKSTFLERFENTVFFMDSQNRNCRLGVSLFGVRGRAGRWESSPPELKRRTVAKFHKSSTSKSMKIYILFFFNFLVDFVSAPREYCYFHGFMASRAPKFGLKNTPGIPAY